MTDQLRIVTTDLSSTAQDLSAGRATLFLAGLYAASVLLRLVGTFLLAVPNIFGDELWHIEFARSVLDWRGLYWGTAHANHPSWLYPLLLAPALRWPASGAGLNIALAINALCISLTPLLTYGMARRHLSRRRSLVAAGLTGLLTGMAYASNMMAENVFLPLAVAAFWLGLRALEQPTVGRRLAAGALLGLLYHAKPQGLFFPLIFAVAVAAEAALAYQGRKRLTMVLSHWLTATACVAVLGLRWLEILHFEYPIHRWTFAAFLGSYADRALGDRPFQWAGFVLFVGGNLIVLTVTVGILPMLKLWPELMHASSKEVAPRRRHVALLAGAVVLVTVLASARHTILADDDWSIYERYLMMAHPLLFIVFAGEPVRLRSGWPRTVGWVVVIAALGGAAIVAQQQQWHLWSNLPSLSVAWLVFAVSGESIDMARKGLAVLVMMPALALLTGRAKAGSWTFGLQVATTTWLLLIMNYGYYVSSHTVEKRITHSERRLARQISRAVPEGKRLVILMDDMPMPVYFRVASRVPSLAVSLTQPREWFVKPLSLSPTGVPVLAADLREYWLLVSSRWPLIGTPARRIDAFNLYNLGAVPPPRFGGNPDPETRPTSAATP